jgi:hypothetical protein
VSAYQEGASGRGGAELQRERGAVLVIARRRLGGVGGVVSKTGSTVGWWWSVGGQYHATSSLPASCMRPAGPACSSSGSSSSSRIVVRMREGRGRCDVAPAGRPTSRTGGQVPFVALAPLRPPATALSDRVEQTPRRCSG